MRRARKRPALVAAAMVFCLAVTGCSGSSSSSVGAGSSPAGGNSATTVACAHVGSVRFAKTKFVPHAGLGAGAFYKFLYKPFKAGRLRKGAKSRIKSMVIGGGAALYLA